MPSPTAIRERYLDIKARLDAAAQRSGRPASSILLIAVTSDAEPEHIRALVELGHIDFGEHRAQNLLQRAAGIEEFLSRHRTLTSDRGARVPAAVRWHMLGELQRPRLRKLADVAQLIHSVDNVRVAEDLQNATLQRDRPVEILLDVNASLSKAGGGLSLPAAGHVAELIHAMFHLRLRGLTTTVPAGASKAEARETYQRCRELFQEIHNKGVAGRDFNVLCMGASSDFEIAVEEGANIVRIGSALFAEDARSGAGPQRAGDGAQPQRESARTRSDR